MPCFDTQPPSEQEILDSKTPAMLCALLDVLVQERISIDGLLTKIDWVRAGVTQDEFNRWWTQHQRRDLERRRREALARQWPGIKTPNSEKSGLKDREAVVFPSHNVYKKDTS